MLKARQRYVEFLIERGDLDFAAELLQEALQVLRKRVDLFWVPDLSELLAKVEEKRGNLAEAKRQLHYAHVAAYLSNRQTAEKYLAELDTVEI